MSTKKIVNVLQVIGGMNRGGAETFLINVMKNMDTDKFRFVLLCYGDAIFDYEEEISELNVRIVKIPDVKIVGALSHIAEIRKIIREYKIDVVHAHTYYNSVFSLIAAKLEGLKLRIAHSHNTRSESKPSFLKKLYFTVSGRLIRCYANQLIACGKDAGYALFGQKSNFKVINNGIDIRRFEFSISSRDKIRSELGVNSQSTQVLLHIGRFELQKNHSYLIDVFSKYKELNPDSLLVLVGDGPLREVVEEQISTSGLERAVRVLGKRSDVSDIYSAADLFVFPSFFEGLPVVLVEVQASGLDALVSDTIDREVKLTSHVYFQSIDSDPSVWAEILRGIGSSGHARESGEMSGGPYDIADVVLNLQDIYSLVDKNSI